MTKENYVFEQALIALWLQINREIAHNEVKK